MEAAAGCGAAGGDEGAARSHGCCEGENEKGGKRKERHGRVRGWELSTVSWESYGQP